MYAADSSLTSWSIVQQIYDVLSTIDHPKEHKNELAHDFQSNGFIYNGVRLSPGALQKSNTTCG